MKQCFFGLVVLLVIGTNGFANASDCDSISCPRPDVSLGWSEVSGWAPESCRVSISQKSFWITFGTPHVGCNAVCNSCSNPNHGQMAATRCNNSYPAATIFEAESDTTVVSGVNPPLHQQGYEVYLAGGGGNVGVNCTSAPCEGIEVFRNMSPTTFHFEFEIVKTKKSYWGPLGAGFDYPADEGIVGPDWLKEECVSTPPETKYVTQSSAIISGEHEKSICDDPQVVTQCAMAACNTSNQGD